MMKAMGVDIIVAWGYDDGAHALKMPYHDILAGGSLGAIDEHTVAPLMRSPAGQSVAIFTEETAVAEVMQRFVREADARLRRPCGAWRQTR